MVELDLPYKDRTSGYAIDEGYLFDATGNGKFAENKKFPCVWIRTSQYQLRGSDEKRYRKNIPIPKEALKQFVDELNKLL